MHKTNQLLQQQTQQQQQQQQQQQLQQKQLQLQKQQQQQVPEVWTEFRQCEVLAGFFHFFLVRT